MVADEDWGSLKPDRDTRRPGQLLKWIGNKYRSAPTILDHAPYRFGTYYEPFLGTGGVLGTLNPDDAIAGDTLTPLVDLWQLVKGNPEEVIDHYKETVQKMEEGDKEAVYEEIKASYNEDPKPLDLLMISRTCYGGVIRFTENGEISTPVGPHDPMKTTTFERRVNEWTEIVQDTTFYNQSFEETLSTVEEDDLVYLDPPYVLTQSILYGAQDFSLEELYDEIERCKEIGAYVMLSIDGSKKSGDVEVDVGIPDGLFEREVLIDKGSSMLRRFQKEDETMMGEDVSDRLLLTW
jgi:DNA adenine methylase